MAAQIQPSVTVQVSEHKLSPDAKLFPPTPYSNSPIAITFNALLPNALHCPLDYLYHKDERAEPGELRPVHSVIPCCLTLPPACTVGQCYHLAYPEGDGSKFFRYLGIFYHTTRCHVPEYFSPNTILVSTVRRAVDMHDTAINCEVKRVTILTNILRDSALHHRRFLPTFRRNPVSIFREPKLRNTSRGRYVSLKRRYISAGLRG